MRGKAIFIFILITALFAAGSVAQAAELKGLNIKSDSIEFQIDGNFTYTIYSPDPYKVDLDLPGVTPGKFAGRTEPSVKGLSEMNISGQNGSTHIELLLETPSLVKPRYEGNLFVLAISPEDGNAGIVNAPAEAKPATAPAAAKAKPDDAPAPLANATEVTDIGFEQTRNAVNLVIKGNGKLRPNVFSLPDRIVVDLPKVSLKAAMPKEVVSPVKGIRSGIYPDKVRLVIDVKKDTPYEMYSRDSSIAISMTLAARPAEKKAAPAPTAGTAKAGARKPQSAGGPPYTDQRISLDFQNADIVPIFMLLGEVSGYNMVVSPSVAGTITLKLKNVPWEQALNLLLETFNLGKKVEGNIMRIAPLSQFDQWKKEEERLKQTEERTEPLVQEVIKLNYAKAADITTAINSGKLLSARGNITTDPRMNTMIVQDTASSIQKIKDLVKIMDVAKPQVMIEAQIVEVSSTYAQSLGINWAATQNINQANGSKLDFSVNTPVLQAGTGQAGSTSPGGVAAITLGKANALQLQLSLNALESISKARKISDPRVLTLDGESASIQQGTSIPVQTTTASGTSTQFVNANLNLSVTPMITPGGYVQMKVTAANDSLGALTPQGYSIERKNVDTQAIVKDGETLVLGGIYVTQENTAEQGIPILSKIPGLGWLFKTRTVSGPNPSELLILITPKIIK